MTKLTSLIDEVKSCTLCASELPFDPRPVIQIHQNAKILIAGQAPGKKVHESGVPFDDASGDRLRDWLGITKDVFYDAEKVAILPMGFCFPGSGKSGDFAPRAECAPAWRKQLLSHLNQVEVTIVLGRYAQQYHLGEASSSVTDLVKSWQTYWPSVIPLPHPSPRNNIWLKKNPWFEIELLPSVRQRIIKVLKN